MGHSNFTTACEVQMKAEKNPTTKPTTFFLKIKSWPLKQSFATLKLIASWLYICSGVSVLEVMGNNYYSYFL